MNKTIYVPDNQAQLIEDAENLFKGETSLSQLILELLDKKVREKKEMEDSKVYITENEGMPVKIIGKKLASYSGVFFTGDAAPGEMSKPEGSWDAQCSPEASHFEFNGYRTRKGNFAIEIKEIADSGIKRTDIIQLTPKTIIPFLKNDVITGKEMNLFTNYRRNFLYPFRHFNEEHCHATGKEHNPGDYSFRFPPKFRTDFQNAIDADEITVIID